MDSAPHPGPINPRGEVSRLYPHPYPESLVAAWRERNIARIDRLTDELVLLDRCRRRSDGSKFESVAEKVKTRAP